MGKLAAVFAGQGAQAPGMGASLYEYSPAARAVLDMAEQLRPGTLAQCFTGTQRALFQTINTQPCICAVDLACAAALTEAGIQAQGTAGFSLGELPALAYAGMLSPRAVFALSMQRAQRMHACALAHPGAMAAVLRLSGSRVQALCQEFEGLYAVNFNAPEQTVIAGPQEAIDAFIPKAAAEKATVLPLAVSGAFHSPYMSQAAEELSEFLQALDFRPSRIPLYANATALPYSDQADPAALLCRQVQSPVRWQQTIQNMVEAGFDAFVELGPGKTLSGLIRKIAPQAAVYQISDARSLAQSTAQLKEAGFA